MRIVGVSGGLAVRSPTRTLVEFVVSHAIPAQPHTIDRFGLAQLAPELSATLKRDDAALELQAALQKIERADLPVVGTPIINGSYAGPLKHLFDLSNARPSEDRVTIIAASNSGDCNSLVLEHSLRPLLSPLGFCIVPTAVFTRDDDFVDHRMAEEPMIIRDRRAIREAFRILGLDPPLTTLISNGHSLDPERRPAICTASTRSVLD
jgi:FMN reductase